MTNSLKAPIPDWAAAVIATLLAIAAAAIAIPGGWTVIVHQDPAGIIPLLGSLVCIGVSLKMISSLERNCS